MYNDSCEYKALCSVVSGLQRKRANGRADAPSLSAADACERTEAPPPSSDASQDSRDGNGRKVGTVRCAKTVNVRDARKAGRTYHVLRADTGRRRGDVDVDGNGRKVGTVSSPDPRRSRLGAQTAGTGA